MDSYDLFNFINAFDEPYKGASTFLNNGNFGKLYLKKVHLHGGDSSNHPFMSGIVSDMIKIDSGIYKIQQYFS